MFSVTKKILEEFDNAHDFERMCADILNALDYTDVSLIAPRGGGDGGKDITFSFNNGQKGLACVTLRKDIDQKFAEDFYQRQPGDFDKYYLFCNVYLTPDRKSKYESYCLDNLHAEFVSQDIEALRSLLDSSLQDIKRRYLEQYYSDSDFRFNLQIQLSEGFAVLSNREKDTDANGFTNFLIVSVLNAGAHSAYVDLMQIRAIVDGESMIIGLPLEFGKEKGQLPNNPKFGDALEPGRKQEFHFLFNLSMKKLGNDVDPFEIILIDQIGNKFVATIPEELKMKFLE